MFNSIEEAVAELKLGKPIIVVDNEDRENEGDFVALSDQMTAETINFMITYGKGLVCTAITEELADQLALPLMVENNTDPYGTAFTVSVDHKNTTTGISAQERAETIVQLTKEGAKAADFKRPGHVFPLIAKKGGVLERPGHTEAAVDLAKLSHSYPSATICEIVNEDGTMARLTSLEKIAKQFDLKIITIESLQAYRKQDETLISREVETLLPTKYGRFQVFGYKHSLQQQEHLAFVKGDIDQANAPIVRIHSECLTGDVFGSYRCDCGPQLESALQMIANHGSGVLVYMRQEGRGIGLLNKLKAYALQDTGLDTVEANEALGFADDEREYYISAQILKDLSINKVQLLTNNPRKIIDLEENGIIVEKRLPIEMPTRHENEQYMKTKRVKLGHELTTIK